MKQIRVAKNQPKLLKISTKINQNHKNIIFKNTNILHFCLTHILKKSFFVEIKFFKKSDQDLYEKETDLQHCFF